MKTFWNIFDVLGLILLAGLAYVLTYTFYVAFIDKTKHVLIDINSLGEANIEAVLIGVIAIWGTVSLGRIIWRLI